MHEALESIQEQLKIVIDQLQSTVPNDEPFGSAHNNWAFPGVSRSELVEEVQSIVLFVQDHETDDLGDAESRIVDYIRRLEHLHSQTIPNMWGNAGHAVPAFKFTMDGLRKVLSSVLTEDKRGEAAKDLREFRRKLRGMESELKGMEPRAASLVSMVERIEQAYSAADQLPSDLESLREAREKIGELVRDATQDQGRVRNIREDADELDKQLNKSAEEARVVLDRCETAYSAATSVGLAAAFSERSKALSNSMWFWIGGLLVALAAGSFFGASQVRALSETLDVPNVTGWAITVNVLLSLLSIGAPVWFAWLATKQIGQRFRLAEDYAFKASISRAYEGFRREAARFDEDMEAKLLASALARLDELPLRLVEADSHGSPWHELASSDIMRRAMNQIPGFAGQVKEFAARAMAPVMVPKERAARTSSETRTADD